MNASERLEKLKDDVVKADNAASADTAVSDALIKSNTETAITIISPHAEALIVFQNAMLNKGDSAQRQAFVMQNSAGLLGELLAW